jgi:hypothetical protein
MPAFPEPFTCGHRVYSATGDDGFGNAVPSWATAVTRNIYGAYPGTPGEDYEPGRNPSTIPLFLLGSTAQLGTVHARDRIVWQGNEFEVDGEPESYDFGPFGYEPGVRVRLKRVEG